MFALSRTFRFSPTVISYIVVEIKKLEFRIYVCGRKLVLNKYFTK